MIRLGWLRRRCVRLILTCCLALVALGVAQAQTGLGQPVILPGDRTPAPAAGKQLQPQIARGSSGSLAVWTDNRSSLANVSFAGPYFGTGLGTMLDIYAARLDATGKVIDTTPIIISEAQYNQSAPQVGWNGQNWLVVWMSERASNRYYLDVLATRVSPSGQVLDPTPILVNSADTSINAYTPWSVASDGTNWSVVWRDLDATGSIFTIDGTRIAPDGTVLDPGGKRLRQDAWNSAPQNADLAFAGDEYLLTWLELSASTGSDVVEAERVSPTLVPMGTPFQLNRYSPSAPLGPRVASDGTNFLVGWFENRYTFAELFGTRVSHTGQVLDPQGLAINANAGNYTQLTLDIAWDSSTYWVAYNKTVRSGNDDLYATRVTPAGTVTDPNGIVVKKGAGNQNQPAIAPVATGGITAVWLDTRVSGDGDIYGTVVAPNGTAGRTNSVSQGAPRQSRPQLAASGSGYLAVYQSEVSGASRVLAQRLDATDAPLGQPIALGPASHTLVNPAVAWNGTTYLVVWEDDSSQPNQIMGRRVLPDGTLPDTAPVAIMTGNQPAVAALNGTFLVVDDDSPTDPHIRSTFATRVSGDGIVLGPRVTFGGPFDVSPQVVALGNRWLIVREAHPSHDNPAATIKSNFVQPDGTPTADVIISNGGFDYTPDVAVSGTSALIVWADHDIFGRRILADGTLLDPAAGIVISNALNDQFTPSVAWDGTAYQAVYEDHRNESYPQQERGDIYATRVASTGSVLDPQGFPVATSPLPETTPAVAAANGQVVFAYAAFTSGAPYDALRITLRTSTSVTAR